MSEEFNHSLEYSVIPAKAGIHIKIELRSGFRIKCGMTKRFVFHEQGFTDMTEEFNHSASS